MRALTSDDLAEAMAGSYYTIAGAGEPLDEWVKNYEEMLGEKEIGKPVEWFTTTGEAVNAYAAKGGDIHPRDKFKPELPFMLFPLTGLNTGRLAIFKIMAQDRWFDDIIQNMRANRA